MLTVGDQARVEIFAVDLEAAVKIRDHPVSKKMSLI